MKASTALKREISHALLPLHFVLLAVGPNANGFSDQPSRLVEIEIKATPFSSTALSSPAIEVLLDGETLRYAPQHSLDGILRDVPGFRLYRRTDSATAHPTTQGVSLGNVGPNGASRSLVLLDGIPMNDPFGGWVAWNRIPPSYFSAVRLAPQAGVSPWGTASLGGVIALDSRFLNDAPFAFVQTSAGDRIRHEGAIAFAQDTNSGTTRIFGGLQETDFAGYPVIRKDRRGSVDINASSRSQSYDAGVRQALAPGGDWHLTLRSQGWQESRNNGTLLTTNSSDALDFSVRLSRDAGPSEWAMESILFAQQRHLESSFSSVSADRSSEKPSLDQYGVPSNSYGFIHRLRIPLSEEHSLGTGFDLRTTEGVTKERFLYDGSDFTKEREAGGRQLDAGVYLQDTWTPSTHWQFHAGTRIEWHEERDGHRSEWGLHPRTVLPEREYENNQTFTPNFTLSSKWTPEKWLEWSTVFYSGARNPTLNELYRPFRTQYVVLLANPELRKESVLGGEFGVQLKPVAGWQLHLRAFENRLRDAIANVNKVQGPGTFPDWGKLPTEDVQGARRENIDRVEVHGLDAGVEWKLGHGLTASAAWLGTHSEVRQCAAKRSLEGRALPQVPGQQISVQLKGDYTLWRWDLDGRWVSTQFDDDDNQRNLASYATLDVRVTRKLGKKTEISAALENATDSEIQTARDKKGTIAIGTPRMWSIGLRREF